MFARVLCVCVHACMLLCIVLHAPTPHQTSAEATQQHVQGRAQASFDQPNLVALQWCLKSTAVTCCCGLLRHLFAQQSTTC
jgi:hypothetical protein